MLMKQILSSLTGNTPFGGVTMNGLLVSRGRLIPLESFIVGLVWGVSYLRIEMVFCVGFDRYPVAGLP